MRLLFSTWMTVLPAILFQAFGQESEHFSNRIFAEKIHSVKVRSTTWEFSRPVIELGSDQHLELIFDDLSPEPRQFNYTLVLCDADWSKSGLQPQEYLSGSGEGSIYESAHSYNTTYDYVHYRVEFPGEDCMPEKSGNYALEVYEAGKPEKIVLTWRIYVVEKLMQVTGQVKQAPGSDLSTSQQVGFVVSYSRLLIHDPKEDITVVIRQNGRDDNAITGLKPSAYTEGRIEFNDQKEGIFKGGNEYRTLDIKSMKYQTENIARFEYRAPYYHVYLKMDKSRDGNPYFSGNDLNGKYFIDEEKAKNKHIEADYAYVHFYLEQPYPIPEDVYVTGELSVWATLPEAKMAYNTDKSAYEATLLIKQGLYDYAYCAVDKKTGLKNEEPFEGSFSETGNDYEIYVYLHESGSEYDQLAGYLPLKSGSF